MESETQSILGDKTIAVSATCIRVPTLRVHAISANVEFSKDLCLDEVVEMIKKTPGVVYAPGATLTDVEQTLPVVVSRVRKDLTQKNTFDFWILGDQLLKGAAYNAYQIYVTLLEMHAPNKTAAAPAP